MKIVECDILKERYKMFKKFKKLKKGDKIEFTYTPPKMSNIIVGDQKYEFYKLEGSNVLYKPIITEEEKFNCGFKALAWLRDNPMREIEYYDSFNKFYIKVRYNDRWFQDYFEERGNFWAFWINHDLNTKSVIETWKDIKVIPKEEE